MDIKILQLEELTIDDLHTLGKTSVENSIIRMLLGNSIPQFKESMNRKVKENQNLQVYFENDLKLNIHKFEKNKTFIEVHFENLKRYVAGFGADSEINEQYYGLMNGEEEYKISVIDITETKFIYQYFINQLEKKDEENFNIYTTSFFINKEGIFDEIEEIKHY